MKHCTEQVRNFCLSLKFSQSHPQTQAKALVTGTVSTDEMKSSSLTNVEFF